MSNRCEDCGHVYEDHYKYHVPIPIGVVCQATVERHIETPGYAPMDVECICMCEYFVPSGEEAQ